MTVKLEGIMIDPIGKTEIKEEKIDLELKGERDKVARDKKDKGEKDRLDKGEKNKVKKDKVEIREETKESEMKHPERKLPLKPKFP